MSGTWSPGGPSNGNDTFNGTSGADTADGLGGNDSLFGGDGADSLVGGEGNDTLVGGLGNDTFSGGSGIDVADYSGNASNQGVSFQVVNANGNGSDGLGGTDFHSGIEVFIGGAGADTYSPQTSGLSATLLGNGGDDFLSGGTQNDSLEGGLGNDRLSGAGSDDTLRGDEGNDTLAGNPGNDSMLGGIGADSIHATTGADTAFGGDDNDTIRADSTDTLADLFFGDGGADSILAGSGADTIDGGVGDDTVNAGGGNDRVFDSGGNNSLDGGANIDRLTFTTAGFYDLQRATPDGPLTIRFLGADSSSGGTSTTTAVRFEEFSYDGGTFDLTAPGWDGSDTLFVCFAAGTRILTATGEVPVEQLQPGDRVVTLAGRGLPVKPVLWVGRRHVVLAGRADAAEVAPIRIKAGALGSNVPQRDLLVSPDHCLHLDGALVPARLLVNGQSVVAELGMAEVTWYHVELETHEVLVAEGAAAESWLDCGNRSWFQNAPVAMLTVPGNLDAVGTGWDATRACAPLVHGGEQLARIRAALDDRAEALAAPQPARMAL